MKKTTRTLLGIGGAFCLIGALLFGIGFTSGGTKYVHSTNLNSMNAQEDNKESANRFTLKKTEIPDFTSLNINLEDSDLNIEESPNEKSYIEYAQATKDKKNPVSYFIENGTLTLKEAGNTGASYYINVDISFLQAALSSKNIEDYTKESSKYENYVTLYLPKDKLVSSAKIYLGYGDFYVKMLLLILLTSSLTMEILTQIHLLLIVESLLSPTVTATCKKLLSAIFLSLQKMAILL